MESIDTSPTPSALMERADEQRGRWVDTDVALRKAELHFIASFCCTGGHHFNNSRSLKTIENLAKGCLKGGYIAM